jgi:hypothetical protein
MAKFPCKMNNEVFEKCWGAGCLLFQDKRVITYYSYYYYVSLGFFLLMFPPRQLLLDIMVQLTDPSMNKKLKFEQTSTTDAAFAGQPKVADLLV